MTEQQEVLVIFDERSSLKRGSQQAAAFDLCTTNESAVTLLPGEKRLFGTGVKLDMSRADVCAFAMPRSGLGCKGLVLANTIGLIDPDYHGEIKLMLWNVSGQPVEVAPRMRAAQLLFLPFVIPTLTPVDAFPTITERGVGGFGSTGVH